MHKKVKEYLNAYYRQKSEEEEIQKQRILIYLGLYTLEDVEVKPGDDFDYIEKINGEKHYYQRKQMVPVPVTDEEYAEILLTLPEDERIPQPIEEEQEDEEEEDEEDAPVCVISIVLMIFAILTWIGGAAASVFLSKSLTPEDGFSLTVLLISLASFLLTGCVFWYASAVQKKLSDIRSLLEELIDSETDD